MRRRGYNASYGNNAALGAGSPVQVVAGAANVRGIIVHRVMIVSVSSTSTAFAMNRGPVLIAKATAPASDIDGDVIAKALPKTVSFQSPTYVTGFGYCDNVGLFVPAGKGLYFGVWGTAESDGMRSVLYEVL